VRLEKRHIESGTVIYFRNRRLWLSSDQLIYGMAKDKKGTQKAV